MDSWLNFFATLVLGVWIGAMVLCPRMFAGRSANQPQAPSAHTGQAVWSTGVIVHYGYGGTRHGQEFFGWRARIKLYDRLTGAEGSVSLTWTRMTLTEAVDAIMLVADRLGVSLVDPVNNLPGFLFYEGDGESPDYPPPDGWCEMLQAEAIRRGWGAPGMWDGKPPIKRAEVQKP